MTLDGLVNLKDFPDFVPYTFIEGSVSASHIIYRDCAIRVWDLRYLHDSLPCAVDCQLIIRSAAGARLPGVSATSRRSL